MRRRWAPVELEPIERVVHIDRPGDEVAASFRGDPDDEVEGVVLVVDQPGRLEWELTRAGLSGSRFCVEFQPDGLGTLVTSRLQPRIGGLRLRLRRRALLRRYEGIVEGVLERVRADLEAAAPDSIA